VPDDQKRRYETERSYYGTVLEMGKAYHQTQLTMHLTDSTKVANRELAQELQIMRGALPLFSSYGERETDF
jgi:hypothetical protein